MQTEEPQFYNEDLDRAALFEALRVGLDTRDFIEKHPIGKAITARATDEIIAARNILETVSRYDDDAVAEAQIRAQAGRMVINWLGEIIMAGNQAEEQLRLQEEQP